MQNVAFANVTQAKAFLQLQHNTRERIHNGLALYHKRYIAECVCGWNIDCKNTRVRVTQNKRLVCSSAYWKGKHREFNAAVQTVSYPAGSFQVT
jgi:hypothetical protein